jgi:hypothetical protein
MLLVLVDILPAFVLISLSLLVIWLCSVWPVVARLLALVEIFDELVEILLVFVLIFEVFVEIFEVFVEIFEVFVEIFPAFVEMSPSLAVT